ncbi:branched-chain amino acid ABC transporter permease [Egibacter rhizosphaerae]|uniref:Branched-chain amino acid ABC transporter permease n=1 Tax=Egibacter rhizosphaerae TaxID=1670831 RepID=A0A411YGT3_9ACTN|nr:branched-chain amino acid ABC transporter permease [Egibacter rhizosphaerae]QBI20397.1 branched-chain amino acid ABC transporter permease [Egibacter rhizosphaerae]
MTYLQLAIDAISLGMLYALVATGLALVFGVMRLINLAHGELLTAGAYSLTLTAAWATGARLLVLLLVVLGLALVLERVAFRPVRDASPATMLVLTFAIAYFLQALSRLLFTAQGRGVQVLPILDAPVLAGDLRLRLLTVVTAVLGAVLLTATGLFLTRTSTGLQMRAAAADFETARLLGVNANHVIRTAFVIAAVLAAAVAVILVVQRPTVTPDFGFQVTIVGLIGVVVGGLDRLVSGALGGFLIGVINSVLGNTLPTDTRVFLTSWLFLAVIALLVLRPQGLFARRDAMAERV